MRPKNNDSSPGRIIPHSFFERKALKVAEELIGKYLVRKVGNKIIREKIIETEAYVGEHDLACHTSRGKTERNKIMFQKAGTIYVYFTYGIHWMLNLVTEKEGCGTAVLIRGTENITGPARLTKALQIDRALNGQMLGKKTGLWVEDGEKVPKKNIMRTPRIGVANAKEGWAEKPYRFILSK